MKACAYCNKWIADEQVDCPFCGHPNSPVTPSTGASDLTAPGSPIPSAREYAGFWRRFGALFIDGLLISVFSFGFGGGTVQSGPGMHMSYHLSPAGTVVGFLYNWLMIALVHGQTLGKMAMRIRIAQANGEAVDLGRSAVRAGMALVSGLAIGLGYLWAAWDPQNRTWHDMVAETRAFRSS